MQDAVRRLRRLDYELHGHPVPCDFGVTGATREEEELFARLESLERWARGWFAWLDGWNG